MATYTYSFTPLGKDGPKVTVKAAKETVMDLSVAISTVVNIGNHYRTITGVIGGEEYTTGTYEPYGVGRYRPEDHDGWLRERDALITRATAHELTKAEIPALIAYANEIYARYVRVFDKRVTAEEHAAKIAARQVAEQERLAARPTANKAAVEPASEIVGEANPLFEIKKDFHDKRQVDIWLVRLTKRVDRAIFDQVASFAKGFGVRWSSWGPATKHGFVFFDEGEAQKFVSTCPVTA